MQTQEHPTTKDFEVNYPKTHAHISQMNIKKFGKKSSKRKWCNAERTMTTTHSTSMIAAKEREYFIWRKKKALRYLMFPKWKRAGTINVRGYKDGRSQQQYTAKDETLGNMLSCEIDDKENRYFAATEIPKAYIHEKMAGTVHMLIEG